METSNSCLVSKSCTPCQGSIPPLTPREIESLLKDLGREWALNDEGHLYKEYTLKDFWNLWFLLTKLQNFLKRKPIIQI